MKNKEILVITMLIAIILSGLAFQVSPTDAQIENFKVTWRLISDGMIHKVWEIEVQNLGDVNKDVGIQSLIENTSFDISLLKNIEFYEWKGLLGERTFWFDNENAPIYSTYVVDNVVYENEDNIIGYRQYSIIENVSINQWKQCKMLMFKKTADSYGENYGLINIPKLGSKPKYDNFETVETENGIKRFRIEFDVPIVQSEKGWGSSGKVALLLDGVEHHPWWDSNWVRRKPITITGTHPENYQLRISLTYDSDMQNDFDDVRFVENEVSGELSYWVEDYNLGENAIIWVRRVENTQQNIDNAIYVYYGNLGATSASNGDTTFILYDHFDGTNVDTGKWNTWNLNVGWSVANSKITVGDWNQTGSAFDGGEIMSIKTFTPDIAVSWRGLGTSGGDGSPSFGLVDGSPNSWGDYRIYLEMNRSPVVSPSDEAFYTQIPGSSTPSTTDWDTTVENLYLLTWLIEETKYYEETTLRFSHTTNVPDADNLHISFRSSCQCHFTCYGYTIVDYVFARTFIDPGPTVNIGEEENRDIAPNRPTSLLCELQTNPTRVTNLTPGFSAIYTDNNTEDNAENAEIWVGTFAGDNSSWVSGWLDIATTENNSRCPDISYAGSTLSRGISYHWQIRFMDVAGIEGNWSTEAATFKLNQLPIVTPTISPIEPKSDENLIVAVTTFDNDEDIVTVYYQWYENNIIMSEENENILDATVTLAGSRYKCSVIPNDNYENGIEIYTAEVTVDSSSHLLIVSSSITGSQDNAIITVTVRYSDNEILDNISALLKINNSWENRIENNNDNQLIWTTVRLPVNVDNIQFSLDNIKDDRIGTSYVYIEDNIFLTESTTFTVRVDRQLFSIKKGEVASFAGNLVSNASYVNLTTSGFLYREGNQVDNRSWTLSPSENSRWGLNNVPSTSSNYLLRFYQENAIVHYFDGYVLVEVVSPPSGSTGGPGIPEKPGFVILFTVTDGIDNRPLLGMRVDAIQTGAVLVTTLTDDEGKAWVTVNEGTWKFKIYGGEYEEQNLVQWIDANQSFNVRMYFYPLIESAETWLTKAIIAASLIAVGVVLISYIALRETKPKKKRGE